MPASDYVVTSTAELAERIDVAHTRFAAVLEQVPDDLPVGPAWTAREVAAHLVTVVNRYTAFAPGRLADAPRDVDAINAREIGELAGATTVALLGTLADEVERFRDQWGPQTGLPLDLAMPFHGGATIDLQSGLTNLLGELLVHGRDVAESASRPWSIDDRDGALLCAFATQILPAYVTPTNHDALSVRFDLEGVGPWLLTVDGPAATSRPARADDDPEVRVTGPATPAALLFYGRLDPTGAVAAGLRIGGAHPERADVLAAVFEAP